MTNYASLNDCKDRLLITTSDTSYDTALNNAGNEATAVVDMFLRPYLPYADSAGNNVTSLSMNNADRQIQIITADIAVSIFKRRMMPEDVTIKGSLTPDNVQEIEARGWFGQGMQKLEVYIRSYCVLAAQIFTSVNNPDLYMDLYNRKIITAREARTFINGAIATVNKKTDTLVRTLTNTETETLTKTVSDTINLHKTSVLATNDIQNLAKTIAETITSGLTKTVTDTENLTITKNLTDTIAEALNRTLTETVTKTTTLSTNDTKSTYHTKKQKSFAWIESDKNGGYKQQGD